VTLGVGVLTAIEGGLVAMLGLGYLVWSGRKRAVWRPGREAVAEAAASGR